MRCCDQATSAAELGDALTRLGDMRCVTAKAESTSQNRASELLVAHAARISNAANAP